MSTLSATGDGLAIALELESARHGTFRNQETIPMNWAAAFFAATIWILAASIWQMYRPMSPESGHRQVSLRLVQDIGPALLLGLLMARVIDV